MSRLDYITIGIIVVCIAALVFFVMKATNLMGDKSEATNPTPTPPPTYDNNYLLEDDTTAISPYFSDEDPDDARVEVFDEMADNTTQPKEASKSAKPAQPERVSPSTTRSAPAEGDYLVLAGAFRVKGNAENEVQRLQKLGYLNAEVAPFNRGAFATVLVDRFSSESDANKLVRELKDKGVEAYVHQRRNQ
jgi:cell division protein FtsN